MYRLATKLATENESKKSPAWVFSDTDDHACIGL